MRKWHVEKMSSYAAGSLPAFHNAPEKNLCRINEQIAFPLFFFFYFTFFFPLRANFPVLLLSFWQMEILSRRESEIKRKLNIWTLNVSQNPAGAQPFGHNSKGLICSEASHFPD